MEIFIFLESKGSKLIEDIMDYCLFYFITISEKVVETQRIDVQFSSDSMLTDSVAKMDSFNLREQLIFNFLLDFSMPKSEKSSDPVSFLSMLFSLCIFLLIIKKLVDSKFILITFFCKRKKTLFVQSYLLFSKNH